MRLNLDGAAEDAVERVKSWARSVSDRDGLPFALIEMAAGAAVLSWGVHNGAIKMGAQLVGLQAASSGLRGALAGSVVGAVGSWLLGNIGVTALGGAIGVPVAVLAVGAAAVLSLAGYGVESLVHKLFGGFSPADMVMPLSALGVGLALLVDGARRASRRLRKGPALEKAAIDIPKTNAPIAAMSLEQLSQVIDRASLFGLTAIVGVSAAGVGSIAATSSVTVLGSQSLGAAALSLGLISAPIWPAIVLGAAAGGGTFLIADRLRRRANKTAGFK